METAADLMRSDTVEDYLKAIYILQEKHGRAKTSALSERLGVTPGSVTDMLKRLAGQKPCLVLYQSHHGVSLTALGTRQALAVIRRHRLLETFLHEVLGYAWDEVHSEAERLEHCLSDRLTAAIADYLHHPERDPHGDPIPSPDGKLPSTGGHPLSELAIDSPARITRVRLQDETALRYLAQKGIAIGETVQILERSPLDGQIRLQLGRGQKGQTASLGQGVAAAIDVESV